MRGMVGALEGWGRVTYHHEARSPSTAHHHEWGGLRLCLGALRNTWVGGKAVANTVLLHLTEQAGVDVGVWGE